MITTAAFFDEPQPAAVLKLGTLAPSIAAFFARAQELPLAA